jgi:hypothetical protein
MIRLTLTLPELEQGYSIQNGPRERMIQLKFMAERKEPISIVPVSNHDQKVISAVLLTDAMDEDKNTSIQIKFRPVWCKTFTVCSYTKDTLLAVVCEFENGQFWVDTGGYRPCKMTLDGNGTDPKAVHRSQYALGDILMERPRPALLHNLVNLVQINSGLYFHTETGRANLCFNYI